VLLRIHVHPDHTRYHARTTTAQLDRFTDSESGFPEAFLDLGLFGLENLEPLIFGCIVRDYRLVESATILMRVEPKSGK
jgi:hypothetical protein